MSIGFLSTPQSIDGRASVGQLDLDRKLNDAKGLENALIAAIGAAATAQRLATAIGFPLKFSSDSVWAMACTLLNDEDTDAVATDHCPDKFEVTDEE